MSDAGVSAEREKEEGEAGTASEEAEASGKAEPKGPETQSKSGDEVRKTQSEGLSGSKARTKTQSSSPEPTTMGGADLDIEVDDAEFGDTRIIDNRYELVDILGEGGFGVVYRARQISTGQKVAVKLLHSDLLDGGEHAEEYVARFEREMNLIGKLKHPNIVRLIDQGVSEEGELYMVLEFIDGQPLLDVLYHEGGLSVYETLNIMSQVLDALHAAHKVGIVHRDLKPANIMLTSTGYRRNAMVLDFGIAGVVEGQRGVDYRTLTRAADIRGTPAYMAPEQLQSKVLTPQSDIYAWGLVFVECLTGEMLVGGDSPFEIAIQQISDDPNEIPPGLLGEDLHNIITQAIVKSRDERFKDAAEVFKAVERSNIMAVASAEANFDLEASATMPLDKETALRALSKRSSEGVAETLAMDDAEFEQAKGNARPGTTTAPTPPAQSSSRMGMLLAIGLLAMVVVNGAGWYYMTSSESTKTETPKAEQAPKKRVLELDQAKDLLMQEPSPESTERAIEHLQVLIQKNASNREAHALLARAYTLRAKHDWEEPGQAYEKAQNHVNKALAGGEVHADAYLAKGRIALALQRDWSAAEQAFRRAVEGNVAFATVYAVEALAPRARFDDALAQISLARDAKVSPTQLALAGAEIAYLAGDFKGAEEQAQALLAQRPDSYFGHYWLGLAQEAAGDHAKALGSLETARSVRDDALIQLSIASILAKQGVTERSQEILEYLLSRAEAGGVVPLDQLALVFVAQGNLEKALQLLERAVKEGSATVNRLDRDPRYSPLRGEAAYRKLHALLGLF